ncbi:hypothetical protein ACTQ34_04040 [Agathobaculum sp. LCP25S3_E8]|uniref:hypothetical protein n=1 Tax=Agathobaculum sp. LCP25S3_E8 TaxID=3438735 RepID=UPI003F90D480
MSFSQNKLLNFSKKISSLRDQPNMQPSELKAYFDSSPEELQQAHNGLCDALAAISAAAGLGFQRTAGVPADTVQAAVENVQSQLTDAVLGNIPSGSVTGDKLAQDVRDRLAAIESTAAGEASTRASADSNLQQQINTHSTQIAAKCEVYIGSYVGDGIEQRTFNLGFQPKALLLLNQRGVTNDNGYGFGGLALPNMACGPREDFPGLIINANGFTVYQKSDFSGAYIYRNYNQSDMGYCYIAFR